jgi:hypothetical protein
MIEQFALSSNQAAIGKIVKSNTHIDYVCQINGPGEALELPEPTDHSFGTFVAIELERGGGQAACLIGVIYNTLLMNPDFGNLGPRLSPRQELEVFTPDYLSETATLVGIIAVGWCDTDGRYHQGVPALAATVNNPVYRLAAEPLRAFHCDERDRPCLRYAPVLMGQNNPLIPSLLIAIIDELHALFPEGSGQLTVMRNNLAWRSMVQPAG